VITLYAGTGSQGFEFISPAFEDEWTSMKVLTIKLLQAKKNNEAASLLSELPFQLSHGTNYFEDEFFILHADLPMEQYIEIQGQAGVKDFKLQISRIVDAFYELHQQHIRFVAVRIATNQHTLTVPRIYPQISSDTVNRALKDAELLLKSNGAPSAVDRVHTALHGYFKLICEKENIQLGIKDPSLTDLFGQLRQSHPALNEKGKEEVVKILRGIALILDSLNNLRNRASMAHPNPAILDENEARLAIHSANTIFHYLDSLLYR
jgi:hypothetical protein